jgi:hypothetical protein
MILVLKNCICAIINDKIVTATFSKLPRNGSFNFNPNIAEEITD